MSALYLDYDGVQRIMDKTIQLRSTLARHRRENKPKLAEHTREMLYMLEDALCEFLNHLLALENPGCWIERVDMAVFSKATTGLCSTGSPYTKAASLLAMMKEHIKITPVETKGGN